MKMFLPVVLLFITAGIACGVQAQNTATPKKVIKWVNSRQWANGVTLNPHASVNLDSFYVAYHRNKKLWDAAFTYLKTQDLNSLPPGKYPIIGDDVFASITDAPSHSFEEVKFESHKNYVDLQYIIRGKELIGVADTAHATIIKPYTPDIINYTADGTYYTTDSSTFFLFFPNNAHRPTIKAEGCDVVKKIVIKIKTAAVQ